MNAFREEGRRSRKPPVGVLALLLCFLGGYAGPGFAQQDEPARVVEVRSWSLGDVTRIAIETTAEVRYRFNRLANPDRIYFDLLNTRLEKAKSGDPVQVIGVGDGLVQRVRYALKEPGVVRVVLDLAAPADFVSSQLTNPDRLMIEVRPAQAVPGSVTHENPATRQRQVETQHPGLGERPAQGAAGLRRTVAGGSSRRAEEIPVESRPEQNPPAASESARDVAPASRKAARPFVPPPAQARAAEPPLILMTYAPPPRMPAPTIRQLRLPAALAQPRIRPLPPAALDAETGKEPVADGEAPRQAKQAASQEAAVLAASPAKTGRYGGRSLTRVLGLKVGRVVLDPGHGGHDTGTIGKSGLMEKELVLDIATRLASLIREKMGSEVFLTREDDRFVSLERRTEIANELKADLFLSIHANSSPVRSVVGMETYYLNFTTSRDALDVAARENAVAQKSIHELSDLIRKIALKDKVEESREFAARVQAAGQELVRKAYGNSARDRGVKKAPFVVLIGAGMPSVLAEVGFISNPKEESLLKKPEHRQKIAEALLKGIESYARTLSHFRVAQRQGEE